jgi:hypothetical protein
MKKFLPNFFPRKKIIERKTDLTDLFGKEEKFFGDFFQDRWTWGQCSMINMLAVCVADKVAQWRPKSPKMHLNPYFITPNTSVENSPMF